MSAVASQKLGPEVLLIFLGHSSDADALADEIYDLERDLQRLLDQHLSVSSELPFRSVRIWEWRKDGLPVVGGQDQVVAEAIKRANIAVFVFKERIGSVSWDELNQSRNKENPTIPVLAFFPTDSPPDLNDEDRIAKWLDLVKKRSELVKDWSAPNSKSLRPMEKYKDAAHLASLAYEQLSNAVVSLLKCESDSRESARAEVLPVKFLGDHTHLSYDRRPVLTRSLDELDQGLLKELLAKPLSQDLNADLKNGRDSGYPEVSEQLENLGCLYEGRPTLGALLCFAPAELLVDKAGCCTLQMAIHDGSERGGERTQLSLVRGNLLRLFDRGMSWLTGGAVLRRRGQIGTDTRDDLEIPEIVLREALANALVHRDYESKVLQDQPTRIDVYPDKVEFTSYGPLMNEVQIELLNSPDQSLRPFRRNPVIAGIFQCMTLAELNASGILRMRRVMSHGGLPLPLFRTSNDFVCVTLARPFELPSLGEQVQNPEPPPFQAVPYYIGLHTFIGRKAQLQTLTDWAKPSDSHSILLFESIGGNGKSMLTWEWVTKHAEAAREGDDPWAGRFWYSFYEQGAIVRDFCQHALAYMTGKQLKDFAETPMADLRAELLTQLHARPWLLILDGLERVLVAYHRIDASEVPDEEANRPTDNILDRDPCEAIRPEDNELLRVLASAAPSKVLISSRLTPRVLLNPSGLPLPGVQRLVLPGLDDEDAEAMLRSFGVSGTSAGIRYYLSNYCANHPLVIGVLGGLINSPGPHRGNFDAWAADPDYGAKLDLSRLDLVQRRNHILLAALEALAPTSRQLLSSLALLTDAVDFDTLRAFNPHLPPEPTEVKEPEPLQESNHWRTASDERKAELREQYDNALARRKEYEKALESWRNSPEVRDAAKRLMATIEDLEERGLVQYDGRTRRYDLHPVVRGFAAGAMQPQHNERFGKAVAH
ncbi:MAG: ATP-binding protein [Fimbriimonas sp.]